MKDTDEQYCQYVRAMFGKAIAGAIKERGLTKEKLEELSGVSKTIIYKVVKGENYEINSLIRIMRILQIHMEFSLMSADNNNFTADDKYSNLN